MALKTLLFVALFLAACAGAFFGPIWPLLGYVAHYLIGPERQWWHGPVAQLGIRYSFTLGALTAAAMFLHAGNLRFGRRIFYGHEVLLLLFLGAIWLSVLIGPPTEGRYTQTDHVSMKMTKVILFTLMLTHVVTDFKNLDRFLWVLILCSMVLGMQAWDTPYSAFLRGRLQRVGGPDFVNSNYFGACMGAMLWLIGVQFIRSGYLGKVVCFISGGFTANAIVLTRSRGALVGLVAGGLMAVCMAPKRFRAYIALGLVLGAAGFYYLSDDRFIERSATILAPGEDRDRSAQNRIELTGIGLRMWARRPWGVGAGNFHQTIGAFDHAYANTDAHSAYIRCLTELGIQGFILYMALYGSAFLILYRLRHEQHALPTKHENDVMLVSFGLMCSLANFMGASLTMSLTYTELPWWFLMLPVCLRRVVDNEQLGTAAPAPSVGALFRG